jgi:hypothetical protein
MEIKGLGALNAQLRERAARAAKDSNGAVLVGFTARYAIYVHEMREPKTLGMSKPRPSGLGVYWGPSQSGPKFLENPAREMNNDGTFGDLITRALRAGRTLMQGLLIAGLRLQREAQMRVPVEYGILRASAFTRLEAGGGGGQEAAGEH